MKKPKHILTLRQALMPSPAMDKALTGLQESKKLVLPTPESQSSNSVKKQQRSQTEEYYESLVEHPVPWLIGHRFTFCIFTSLAHKLMHC